MYSPSAILAPQFRARAVNPLYGVRAYLTRLSFPKRSLKAPRMSSEEQSSATIASMSV